MHSMEADPVQRTPHGFLVVPRAHLPAGVSTDSGRTLVLGSAAYLDGGVECAGRLLVQPCVRIGGPVRAEGDVVLGARAQVAGPLESGGEVRVLPDAVLHEGIQADADVHLYAGCRVVGAVRSGGDIFVHGDVETGPLEPRGRVESLPFEESEREPASA